MKSVTIAGRIEQLRELSQQEKSGLWLELFANFKMMQFEFNGSTMLLLKDKNSLNYSPTQRRKISERIEGIKHIPVVFYFDNLPTNVRDRLVNQGVYFVVSDKYAFVPTLIINRKSSQCEIKDTFYPSTQYILLYHLQVKNLNGVSLSELEGLLPYKYKTISKSVKQLEWLGLAHIEGTRSKSLYFDFNGKALWEKSSGNLVNPIKNVSYMTCPLSEGNIGGISALSHYSMLAPEDIPTRVMTKENIKELCLHDAELHRYEDVQRIEIWKYPPLGDDGYVDRLSLYLTLKEDKDPRVEKELEIMMEEIKW